MYWQKHLKELIFIFFIGGCLQTNAQVLTIRQDFENEGFGVMVPLKGVTVKSEHFLERYEPLYEGSSVVLIKYLVDTDIKKSTETDLQLITALKATIQNNPGLTIREDISAVQKTRNNYPYRSLKLTTGTVNIDHFFFFRNDLVVLLRFEYKASNKDYLSDVVASAVNQFLWLEPKTVLTIKEMGARIKLPAELKGVLNKSKTSLLLSYTDSLKNRYFQFRGNIEFLGESGKYDTAKIKTVLLKEIKNLPSSRLVFTSVPIEMAPDYIVEKYRAEFIERGQEMELYVFLIYTGKKMYRYSVAGAHDFFYNKANGIFTDLIKAIQPL